VEKGGPKLSKFRDVIDGQPLNEFENIHSSVHRRETQTSHLNFLYFSPSFYFKVSGTNILLTDFLLGLIRSLLLDTVDPPRFMLHFYLQFCLQRLKISTVCRETYSIELYDSSCFVNF
jgi:hypothetical protein